MSIKTEEIKKELKLRPFGQKGWFTSKDIECPDCHRSGKFGVLFTKDSGIVHCFFCDYKTSIQKYLISIDKKDLISFEISVSKTQTLKSLNPEPEIEEEKEDKEVKLPFGLKPLVNDEYLNGRRFLPEHYKNFEPSYTDSFLEKKLHNNIIFKIKQEGKLASWLSRSRKNYDYHSNNLKQAKLGLESLELRYNNSEGTEFDKILGGYDEITENTETIILVEGLFDKVGTDNNLDIFTDESMRCLFTFGNAISHSQIDLLKRWKNIKFVILLYDYGTTKQSKEYAFKLQKSFFVMVGVIKDKKLDPGDMNEQQLNQILDTLQNPMEFYVNNLNETINGKL